MPLLEDLFLKKLVDLFRNLSLKNKNLILILLEITLKEKIWICDCIIFLFGATPLPSNFLFITYGLMRAKSIGIYLDFGLDEQFLTKK